MQTAVIGVVKTGDRRGGGLSWAPRGRGHRLQVSVAKICQIFACSPTLSEKEKFDFGRKKLRDNHLTQQNFDKNVTEKCS